MLTSVATKSGGGDVECRGLNLDLLQGRRCLWHAPATTGEMVSSVATTQMEEMGKDLNLDLLQGRRCLWHAPSSTGEMGSTVVTGQMDEIWKGLNLDLLQGAFGTSNDR